MSRENPRSEAWAAYYDDHPEVLVNWSESNGREPPRTWRQHMEQHHGWMFPADEDDLTIESKHMADHDTDEGSRESFSLDEHTDDHDEIVEIK